MESLVAVRRIGIALLAAGTALLVSSVASAHPTVGAARAQSFRASSWVAPAPRSPNAPMILHVASPRAGKRTVVVGGGSGGSGGAFSRSYQSPRGG